MCQLCRWTDWGMERLRRFTVWDVAVFKTCLLGMGMLIGMYFVKPLKKLAPLVWIVTLCTYVYIVWRMVVQDE